MCQGQQHLDQPYVAGTVSYSLSFFLLSLSLFIAVSPSLRGVLFGVHVLLGI